MQQNFQQQIRKWMTHRRRQSHCRLGVYPTQQTQCHIIMAWRNKSHELHTDNMNYKFFNLTNFWHHMVIKELLQLIEKILSHQLLYLLVLKIFNLSKSNKNCISSVFGPSKFFLSIKTYKVKKSNSWYGSWRQKWSWAYISSLTTWETLRLRK